MFDNDNKNNDDSHGLDAGAMHIVVFDDVYGKFLTIHSFQCPYRVLIVLYSALCCDLNADSRVLTVNC